MASRKGLNTVGITGLTVIAPLCLAIQQVREALEFLGLSMPVAGGLSLVLLGFFLAFSVAGILSGYCDHRCRWLVLVGLLSAAAILFFAITRLSALAGYLSCVGLITAGVGNIILRRRHSPHRGREISRDVGVVTERDYSVDDLRGTD